MGIPYQVDRAQEQTTAFARWLTVERACYAAAALVAIGLRLLLLGDTPPNPDEAAHALQALEAARGLPFDMAGASPLLFHLQRITLTLFSSDSMALRLWPALLGGLSVLCFYAFRYRLGAGGALMAAVLWAISPLAIFASRQASGDALVATLALATAAALEMAWQDARSRNGPPAGVYPALAGIGLALLLLSGPGAYTVLLAALLAAVIWRNAARALVQTLRPRAPTLGLAFILTLGLGATLAFTTPQGLAAAFDLPGRWLEAIIPGFGEYGALEVLGRLIMSEALIVALALVGAGVAVRHRYEFLKAAAFMALVALVVLLLGKGRHPSALALVVLPLTLLAGPVGARIVANFLEWRTDPDAWLLALVNLALLLAAAYCLPGAFNPAATATWRRVFLVVGAITLSLAALEWIVYGIWGSWRAVAKVAPAVFLALGLLWNVSQIVGINYDRGAWRRAGVLHETTEMGYSDLENALRNAAAQKGRGAREVAVDLVLTPGRDAALEPVLRWLLRDFPMVTQSAALPLQPAPIVISAAEAQPALQAGYRGADFSLVGRWQPAQLPNAYARLRWVLFRETFAQPETQNAVLWVRAPDPYLGPTDADPALLDLAAPGAPGAAP